MKLATATLDCDRFEYVAGSALFWTEHHEGMMSEGYRRLSFYNGVLKYCPGISGGVWESLSDSAKDIYRAWCERESVECDYDTLRYVLTEADWDLEDPCVEYFLEHYTEADPEQSGLCNYDRSDFVNCDMCYTHDLLRFYSDNEESILKWVDDYCDAIGATSRLEALAGEDFEDPDGFAMALVNRGMTYLAERILSCCRQSEGGF